MARKLEYFARRRVTAEPLWKVMAYTTSGVNFPVESNESWNSEAAATAAAERVNNGDTTGVTFSSFADD